MAEKRITRGVIEREMWRTLDKMIQIDNGPIGQNEEYYNALKYHYRRLSFLLGGADTED